MGFNNVYSDGDNMSLEYVFQIGEKFEVNDKHESATSEFIEDTEQYDRKQMTQKQVAGYLAQFVIADNYALPPPTIDSRFDLYDFVMHKNTVDMKASMLPIPSLIIESHKIQDADVFLLFTVNSKEVTFLGGTTQQRIIENPDIFKLQNMNGKLVYMLPASELTNIKIDALGVEEYV